MANSNYRGLPPLVPGAPSYPPAALSQTSREEELNYNFGPGFGDDTRDWRVSTQQPPQPVRRQQSESPTLYHSPSLERKNQNPSQNPTEVARIAAQYYQSLVEYYYPYALDGIHAPVQNSLQEKAKEEAFYWAQQAQPIPPPLPPAPLNLPHPPLPSPSTPTLPTRPSLPAIPQKPFISSPTILSRSTSVAVPPTAVPLPSIPGAGMNRSNSAAATFNQFIPLNAVASSSRGALPTPPSRTGSMKLTGLNSTPIDTVTEDFGEKMRIGITQNHIMAVDEAEDYSASPVETTPALPTFSFGEEDSGGIPTFSFGEEAVPKSYNRPHPRDDPSHPSHPLYRPKSTLDPINSNSRNPIDCAGCGLLIIGRTWMAVGKAYHPDCFICEEEGCGISLESLQFGVSEGKGYCMVHFEERFSEECYQCQTPISDSAFITVTHADLLAPTTRTYHSPHFFCSSCGDPFLDQTVTPSLDEPILLTAFEVVKGYPYCLPCDTKLYKPKCKKCRLGISGEDGMIEALGEKFHDKCFGCATCGKGLEEGYLVKDAGKVQQAFCSGCY